MKKLLPVLAVVAALLLIAAPAFADVHTCDHDATTVESLHHCVMHAYEMGHITNQGVYESLTRELDQAQAALNRGQTKTAVNLLNAFVKDVRAQAGVTIDSEHATHFTEHAGNVIAALGG